MNKITGKFLASTLTISMLATSFSSVAEIQASTNTQSNTYSNTQKTSDNGGQSEQDINKLAHTLSVLYDDAAVYNEENNEVKFRESVLKEELSQDEYDAIIGDLRSSDALAPNTATRTGEGSGADIDWAKVWGTQKQEKAFNKCVSNKLGTVLAGGLGQGIQDAITKKDYKGAAKKIAKKTKKKPTKSFIQNGIKVIIQCNMSLPK